jgi:hypothetical protein
MMVAAVVPAPVLTKALAVLMPAPQRRQPRPQREQLPVPIRALERIKALVLTRVPAPMLAQRRQRQRQPRLARTKAR